MNTHRTLALLGLLSALTISHATADSIYLTGNDGTSLFTVDSATGTGTFVGNFGATGVYADAFDNSGTLWAVANGYSDGTLAHVDTSTGAAAAVGSGSGVADLMAMAFGPDGTLYVGSWGTNDLYTMDTSTGAVTLVGALGFGELMGFDFDHSGNLYAIASNGPDGSALYNINLSTGAGTLVTNIAADSCLMGITIDSANRFLATDYCSSNSPLYQIDTTTGALTSLGSTGIAGAMGGDINDGAPPVPEPSSLMLMATGVMLVCGKRLGINRTARK